MDKTRVIPAHSTSTDWGIIARWILCVIYLLFLFLYTPVLPVAARPASHPPSVINGTDRIELSGGVSGGALTWGDFDNDGDLDLLASGTTNSGTGDTAILTNNNGSFSKNLFNLKAVQASSATWGDYDNDGFLDILLTGYERVESGSNVIGFAGVYHNEPGSGGRTFTLKQTLPNIYWGSGTWGDYNNDGRLDILLTGNTDAAAPFARIYHNTGNFSSSTIFSGTGTPSVTPVGYSATAWADFDKNGYIDFAVSGRAAEETPITQVYQNNRDGTFNLISLTGLWDGTVNFIDYNLDSYPDILVTGNTGTNISPNIHPTTILYRYNPSNGTFVEVTNTGLPNIWNSSVSIGDYNNDGYPDVALAGKAMADQPVTLPNQVYINDKDGTFTNANAGLPDGAGHVLAWGDYNGDLTLDLALTGISVINSGQETYYTYIYPNTPIPNGNTAPSAPTLQSACWDGSNRLTLRWSSANDGPAPANSLSYNVRVGTTLNGQDILNAASDSATGRRRLATIGNANTNSAVLLNLANGTYYWSVQAIDAAYVGGPFANTSGRVINLGTRVANDDAYSVDDNLRDVTFNVLSNDSGDGSPITIYSYSQPSHGSLILDTVNDVLLYTPNEPYVGSDQFDYYAIRDNTFYCSKGTVQISVTQHNDPPTDISLTNNQVPDGSPSGTLVGRFSTSDPDVNQTFVYSLVQQAGYDFSAFRITGNQLFTNTEVDYTTKSSYLIRIRTTDQSGSWFEKNFTILVLPNHAPTDIILDKTSVLEKQAAGTSVGRLSTTDADAGDRFVYTLVPDPENPENNYDNNQFYIVPNGTYLRTSLPFDYNTHSSFKVRIRTTDRAGLYFDEIFTINILPTIPSLFWLDSFGTQHPSTQPPPAIVISEDSLDSYGRPDAFHLTILATDLGLDETLQWSISQQAAHGTANASETTTTGQQIEVGYTPQENWNSNGGRGNDNFTVCVTDSSGNKVELPVTVTIKEINDPPLFENINDQVYIDRSAIHSIVINGIVPGPANEIGQAVQMYAYCMQENNCDGTKASDLSITPVQADGTAILTFTLGPGARTEIFSIQVVARDNQPLNNTYSLKFAVSTIPGIDLFLPIILR